MRAIAFALALCLNFAGVARAEPLEQLAMNIFSLPSLGAMLPPIIKAQGFDTANGLDLSFTPQTPEAYAADFNSGRFQVGGSATPSNIGVAALHGADVTYVFNIFDFWGAVVTGRPDIKTLKDLEGHDLAAAKSTLNYVMFSWIARQHGVDVSKISVLSTATAGLVGYAMADRAAAVQLWEPAYTQLVAQRPNLRTIDMEVADTWERHTGSRHLPYLGIGAHTAWLRTHPSTIVKLVATYKAAAAWMVAHPDEAAVVIAPKGSVDERSALATLIRANERLGLDLQWASDQRRQIDAVYEVAKSVGFLSGIPAPDTIYERDTR